jgi:GT2 family glycosyltransferase
MDKASFVIGGYDAMGGPLGALGALFSFCIPVHNRTRDLKRTLPRMIEAANASPPVEIAILDYNSRDDLADYIASLDGRVTLTGGSRLAYTHYGGRDYYHMAHARNLSVLASSGQYLVIFSADLIPLPDFIPSARRMMAEGGYAWLHDGVRFVGVLVIQRQAFLDAGGYDERFEFYGPEDKDLIARLRRRGCSEGQYPEELLDIIDTPDHEKVRHYRLPMTKQEMGALGRTIFEENKKKRALVANPGGWGSWVKA